MARSDGSDEKDVLAPAKRREEVTKQDGSPPWGVKATTPEQEVRVEIDEL